MQMMNTRMKKTTKNNKVRQIVLMVIAVCFGLQIFGGQMNADTREYSIGLEDNYAPFSSKNEIGQWVGISPDLMKEIAALEGFECRFVEKNFKEASDQVLSGEIDATMPVSIIPERQAGFDFSEPFFKSGIVAAIYQGTDINSLEDLKGKKVGVKRGTTDAMHAYKLAAKYNFTVVESSNTHAVYNDVIIGKVAATFDDEPIIESLIDNGVPLKIITKPVSITSNSLIVKKGTNSELIQKFNHGLAQLKKSGRYDEIVKQYMPTKRPQPTITAEMTTVDMGDFWRANKKVLLLGLVLLVVMFGVIWVLARALALSLYHHSKKHPKLDDLLERIPAFIIGNVVVLVVGVVLALVLAQFSTFNWVGWIIGVVLITLLEGLAFAKRLDQVTIADTKLRRKVLRQYHLRGVVRDILVLAMAGYYIATATGTIKMMVDVYAFEIWSGIFVGFIVILSILTIWQRKVVHIIEDNN
ncbi:transporter substrate-binding domain-containing protein [Periweissella cryptocerci]|uniref:Transporter substrate-binding domain-containing protein n=1 Tax=Periweissella cryptocerci TaxID=2506420 RepID=A0A4P6YUI8_9LACO|nr:transporter substrate-binding domain-containing protein [Periweissella cryptocerci]QBO36386.1 transporter substrate-binding domain-containing protein [Periweissella cryptocerci]